MEKKIRSRMREKGLLDLTNVVIDPPFTKKVMEYPNSSKTEPPPIDLYDGTKDLVDHVQTFLSHSLRWCSLRHHVSLPDHLSPNCLRLVCYLKAKLHKVI